MVLGMGYLTESQLQSYKNLTFIKKDSNLLSKGQ